MNNIVYNKPVKNGSDVVIIDRSANIRIDSNLRTSGKIYVLGKNVVVNAKVQGPNVTIIALNQFSVTKLGNVQGPATIKIGEQFGKKELSLNLGSCTIKAGRINPNLQKVITN